MPSLLLLVRSSFYTNQRLPYGGIYREDDGTIQLIRFAVDAGESEKEAEFDDMEPVEFDGIDFAKGFDLTFKVCLNGEYAEDVYTKIETMVRENAGEEKIKTFIEGKHYLKI